MAKYTPIEKNPYYRRNRSVPKNENFEKPSIHFYPDITDELLKSKNYDIPFLYTFASTAAAIEKLEDEIHTLQMSFANQTTARTYDCYVHYMDPTTDTQKIGLIGFGNGGAIMIREWV